MNYYSEIKKELVNNEITKKVKDYSRNKSDLDTYYNVGNLLKKAGKNYGEGIIKDYALRLTSELGKGYTPSRLRYMRRYYEVLSKCPTMSDKLSYSHYCELIWFDNVEIINYYIEISNKQNLSVRELRNKIKNKEYERLEDNTKLKLIDKEENKIEDFIKNPILIKKDFNYTEISEKILKKLILEDMDNFLQELGEGFCYIGNEYKIKIGERYNYIDILLFNIKYNCYVVLELKITELKKEHIGQIQIYMNYIDKNIKNTNQSKTIGIIIVKKNNKFIIDYSSDDRLLSRKYSFI